MPPQEQIELQDESWQVSQSWQKDDDVEASRRHCHGKGNSNNVNSTTNTNSMEQLDPFEPVERRSIFHRESFLMQFASKKGPRSIVLLIFCLALGLGSTIGVVPAVMTDRFARLHHNYAETQSCAAYDMAHKPQACLDGSADAQNASAMESLISNTLTFITSSLMGSLSDEHGRRTLLVIGVFMSTLSPLCLVLIQVFPTMSPLWYYGAGASTGLINWMAIALSSLSDVMPPEWRAASFGMLMAGLSLGFAMSPSLALFLTHFQVSCLACTMIWVGFLVTLFFFPETVQPEQAARAAAARSQQTAGMTTTWQKVLWNLQRPAWELSILNRNNFFRLLAALAFFSGMVSAGDQTLLLYYVEERLAFNDHDVAQLFMLMGLLGIFAQACLLKPFISCAGERMVITFCFVLGAMDNFMYGIAKHKAMIFAAISLGALTNMSFPTISAVKANNVSEAEQGRIQGALYSVKALASGTGPMAMRYVYHFTKDGAFLGPGSMFVFASGLMLVAAGSAYALPRELSDSRYQHSSSSSDCSDHSADETERLFEQVSDDPLQVSQNSTSIGYGGIDETS